MTLSVALFNALSGLRLNQTALDVTAQNVANVNTDGYSRKVVQQEARVLGGMGAGVKVTKIARNVDEFVLKDMREALAQVNDSRTQDGFYQRIQNLFGSLDSDSSISAYVTELATRPGTTGTGSLLDQTTVCLMSEFGRTVKENGSAGTDHGHGNVMFVMGGPVQGGKVYGDWPGLAQEQLYEKRDLAVTTDFLDVFAELLVGHLGCEKPEAVFPRYELDPKRFRGLLKT